MVHLWILRLIKYRNQSYTITEFYTKINLKRSDKYVA